MRNDLSTDEARERDVSVMGKPLGELHFAFRHEVVWLHVKWSEYRALFASDKETLDLLNHAAPAFFHNLQRLMWEDVLLHLCRLTDPPKSAGKDNLTLMRIPLLISDPDLKKDVEGLANTAKDSRACY